MPLLELELEGSLEVKDRIAGAITIFVDAPLDELERRLRGRATESGGEIEERIALARRAEGARRAASTTWSRTTTASGPPTSASPSSQRELNSAATMARR